MLLALQVKETRHPMYLIILHNYLLWYVFTVAVATVLAVLVYMSIHT